MYDRDTAMLDQYDLTVKNIRKVRSGWLCTAQEGMFVWKECSSGEDRLNLEDMICREIEGQGLRERWEKAGGNGSLRMDRFVRNREGSLLTEDHFGRCFVLKEWTEGKECEVRTLEDLYHGVRAAACMHQTMRQLKTADIEERLIREKEQRMKEQSVGETEEEKAVPDDNRDTDPVKIAHLASGESCLDLWMRRKKEITRVQSYIRRRKNKNALEQLIMRETPYFAEQAEEAIMMLGEVSQKTPNRICHGDFHYHNLIYSPEENWICRSSRFYMGPQIADFYLFLRKCMEKHNWNWSLAENLLTIYQQNCSIEPEELQFLYCLFLFPEKYWKQLNFYIQSNKAWMPEKNVVKLQNVIGLEAERQTFLEKFRGILE